MTKVEEALATLAQNQKEKEEAEFDMQFEIVEQAMRDAGALKPRVMCFLNFASRAAALKFLHELRECEIFEHDVQKILVSPAYADIPERYPIVVAIELDNLFFGEFSVAQLPQEQKALLPRAMRMYYMVREERERDIFGAEGSVAMISASFETWCRKTTELEKTFRFEITDAYVCIAAKHFTQQLDAGGFVVRRTLGFVEHENRDLVQWFCTEFTVVIAKK